MNEEIQFGMGIDVSPLAKGIRHAKEIVKEGGEKMRESLNEFGKAAFAPLAAIASVEGVRRVLEFGEGIERGAKIAGTSTDFFQTLNAAMRQTGGDAEKGAKGIEKLTALIGDAREGNKEAVETFDKLGIKINDTNGVAKDTETIFREVADKVHNAATAQERAAIATDAFGKKLGLELIPALEGGSAALDKFGASASKLSEDDLKTLSQLNKDLNEMANTAQVWSGKVIAAIGSVAAALGALSTGPSGLTNYFAGLANDDAMAEKAKAIAASATKNAEGVAEMNQIVDLMAKLDDANKDADFSEMSKEDQLTALWDKQIDLKQQIADLGEDAIASLLKQIELAKVDADIAKKKKEIDKEAAAEAKKWQADQDKIDKASLEVAKANDKLGEAKSKRSQLSVDDLTGSRFRFSGQLGQDQQTAFQIKRLEAQGEWNRQHGFLGDSKDRFDSADKLRATLSSNVPESERFPFKSLQETSKEAADHLAKIVDNISEDGLSVYIEGDSDDD